MTMLSHLDQQLEARTSRMQLAVPTWTALVQMETLMCVLLIQSKGIFRYLKRHLVPFDKPQGVSKTFNYCSRGLGLL